MVDCFHYVFTSIIKHNITLSSWWVQPIWTMSQMESFSPVKVLKKMLETTSVDRTLLVLRLIGKSILSLVLGALHGIAYK